MEARKTMVVQIGNEKQFGEAVDQHALLSAKAAVLLAQAKVYKQALEAYAFGGTEIPEHLKKAEMCGTRIVKGIGEIKWSFECGTASIRMAAGVELPYVIEKLLATKKTADCVFYDYDSDKLRALYGDKPEALEKFGLCMAQPEPKFKLVMPKALKEKAVA